jgi:uncharacterized protein
MSEHLAGLMLGLAGSLHCAVMCGPLMLTLRRGGGAGATGRGSGVVPLVAYHAARLAAYGTAGIAAGAAGDGATMLGAGRALAWVGGVVLLASAASHLTVRPLLPLPSPTRLLARLGSASRLQTTRAPLVGALVAGALNACLPCGMVYAALTVAASTGAASDGLRFMLLFGVGTVPALLGTWLVAGMLTPVVRRRLRYSTPVALAVVGLLLIARGYSGGVTASAAHPSHVSAHAH